MVFMLHFLGIGIDEHPSFLPFAVQSLALLEHNQPHTACHGDGQDNQGKDEACHAIGYDEADNGKAYRGCRPIDVSALDAHKFKGTLKPLEQWIIRVSFLFAVHGVCGLGKSEEQRKCLGCRDKENTGTDHHHDLLLDILLLVVWAKHPAPYPPCGGRFPSTRPQTVLTCLHVYGFPLVTLLFTIVLNHRVAVLTDNQCLAMSFEHQFLPLIIAFQLGESPHMMHDYFSFLTT